MHVMNFPFDNARELVVTLRKRHFPGYYGLPYNRFEIDNSKHWWLSPTSEKAAFKYGKALFTTDDSWVRGGEVFCGFNVEKGVEAEGSWNSNNLMNDSWFWHRFLEVAHTQFVPVVEAAREAVKENLKMYIASGIPVQGEKWDRVVFEINDASLTVEEYEQGNQSLSGISNCSNITELADALQELSGPKSAWHWIDIIVGRSFTLDVNGDDNTDDCAAMLKCFENWMRYKT